MLTLDALRRAAEEFESEVVTIAGLPEPARFRDISGTDRDLVLRFLREPNAGERDWEFKCLVVALSLCDDTGATLVPHDQVDQVLGRLGGRIIGEMYQVAARVSGLLPSSVEEAEKNSEAGQS